MQISLVVHRGDGGWYIVAPSQTTGPFSTEPEAVQVVTDMIDYLERAGVETALHVLH